MSWVLAATRRLRAMGLKASYLAVMSRAATVVAARRPEVEYDVEVGSDRLYIVHNDGAPDFALAWAPLDSHSAQDWQELRAG